MFAAVLQVGETSEFKADVAASVVAQTIEPKRIEQKIILNFLDLILEKTLVILPLINISLSMNLILIYTVRGRMATSWQLYLLQRGL
jgi:hypothetical protein